MDETFSPEKEEERIIEFIKNVMEKTHASGVVVAVSGGVDSATVLALVVRAIGPEKTYTLMLPAGEKVSREGTKRAESFIRKLHIPEKNIQTIDIKSVVDAISEAANLSAGDHVRKGNCMARARMIMLYDFAKEHGLIVAGTENKSEYLLGYYTRFGDEASDFEPIRHLYKTQVYRLGRNLGVLEEILLAKPSADLWSGQTDEGEMGFSYDDADKVLFQYFDELQSIDQIKKHFVNAEKIIAYTKKNHFKHEVPYILWDE